VLVAVEPFEPVGAEIKRGARAEAERLAGFLGAELVLEWAGSA
jgi:hypothetical protein